MSEPDAEPTPSLIQQRLALQRRRVGAVSLLRPFAEQGCRGVSDTSAPPSS